jgi:NitT/TauT family transport system substrate-binding protein
VALLALLVTAVLALVSACGLLNGSSDSTAPGSVTAAPTGAHRVEKPAVTMGILAAPDDAPAELAQLKGIFAAQGLTPVIRVFQSGPAMYPALMNGSLDIGLTNYVNFFSAVHQNTLNAKVIAAAYAGTPSSVVLLTPAGSPVRTAADLAGRTIATQAPGNICELLVRALLHRENIDPSSPRYVPIHFPDMPSALKSGQVDAAVELEPFITEARRGIGATEPFPLLTGDTTGIPLSGYVANDDFIRSNPLTVAAFQRAIVQANQRIGADGALADVLPRLTGVDPALVPALHIGAFPTTLDPGQLQRVITLMRTYGYLSEGMAAKDFVVPIQTG